MRNTVYQQNGFKIVESKGFYYVKRKSFALGVIVFYQFVYEGEDKKIFNNFSQAYEYVKSGFLT